MAQTTYKPVKGGDIQAGAITGASVSLTGSIAADTVSEYTAAAGVTVDGVLLKDTAVYGRTPQQVLADDGAITVTAYNKTVILTKGTASAITLAAPTAGTHDGVTITVISTTAAAHTVTHTAGFGGGTTSRDVATFGGAINDGFEFEAYNGVWYVKYLRNVTLA